jgi:enamine deaminase RidA (YjgF/YER057c/UK114 family)
LNVRFYTRLPEPDQQALREAAPMLYNGPNGQTGDFMAIHSSRTKTACLAMLLTLTIAAPAWAKECFVPDARAKARAFSRVVTTEGGKTLWLAGHTADPKTGFDQQARQIFSDLDKNIKARGGAGLADIVSMTVFITDTRLGDRFIELRKQAFKDCFPASALITIAGLAQPGLLIEIQGIAVVGSR